MKLMLHFILISMICGSLFATPQVGKFNKYENLSNISQDITTYLYLVSLDIEYDKNKEILKDKLILLESAFLEFKEEDKDKNSTKKSKYEEDFLNFKKNIELVLNDEVSAKVVQDVDIINSKIYNNLESIDINKTDNSTAIKWLLISSQKMVNDMILIYRNYKFEVKRAEFKVLYKKYKDILESVKSKVDLISSVSWKNYEASIDKAIEFQDEKVVNIVKNSNAFNTKLKELLNIKDIDSNISLDNNETNLTNFLEAAIKEQQKRAKVIKTISKQSTIIQKITKNIFLFSLGIERDNNLKSIKENSKLFGESVEDLLNGTKEIPQIRDKNIISTLKKIKKEFESYEKNMSAILKSNDNRALLHIINSNEEILNLTIKAKKEYRDSQFSKKENECTMAKSVDLSATLQMLTQKLLKEKILIITGMQPNENKKSLNNSIETFDEILKAFINGDKKLDIKAVTNDKIKASIKKLSSIWKTQKNLFKKDNISDKELTILIKENDKFEKQSANLIDIFENEVEK